MSYLHMFVEWRKAWLNWAAALFVLFYTLALLTIQRQTHDLVALNDFWGNAWLAAVWDWNDPASWPNGFHPVGFTVLLHEVCRPTVDHYDIQRSVGHINCVFSALGLVAVWALAVCRLGVNPWVLAALIGVSISDYFEMSLLQTSDIGCLAFTTLGLALLHSSGRRQSASGFPYLRAGCSGWRPCAVITHSRWPSGS